MQRLGWIALGLAAVAAVGDWLAVARQDTRREYVLKPLVMVLLLGAALAFGADDPGPRRWWTAAAVVLSGTGDVFLMLRRQRFVAGLAAFLLAHVAYVLAFGTIRPDAPSLAAFAAVLALGAGLYVRLVRGMRAGGEGGMAVPVAAYNVAIAAMVTSAILTAVRPGWAAPAVAIAGAVLFMVSDSMIGWSRFVSDFTGSRVAIIVTYHLGQFLLVVALLRLG